MCRWRGVVGVLAAGVLAASAWCSAPALAARYHVYGCHTPDGQVAPIDGWSSQSANTLNSSAFDDCGGSTTFALTAELDGGAAVHPANASSAGWSFISAANLTFDGATIYRHESVGGGAGPSAGYISLLAAANLSSGALTGIDSCRASLGCGSLGTNNGGFDPSNRVSVGPVGSGQVLLLMQVLCSGADGANCPSSAAGYAAEGDLYAADVTLEDDTAPTLENVTGPLIAGGTLTGRADVRLGASDGGSGVYSAVIRLDGKPVSTQVIDDNGGHCKTVGLASDGLRDFFYEQPCLSSVHADLQLDTSAIPDGAHHLQITVDDAAGNAASVFDGTITTRNAPIGGQPKITGVLAQGQRLAANPGSWSPTPASYAYQWLRCAAGAAASSCRPIPGAVGDAYVPITVDDYQSLALDVTATDAAGSTTVRTPVVGPVADLSGATSAGQVTAQSGGLKPAGTPPGTAAAGHAPNGAGACATALMTAGLPASATGRVGLGRPATVSGRLTCAGKGVAGATIAVSIRPSAGGGAASTATARTAADGSFSVGLRPGPSRTVTLAYTAFADDAGPAATRVLQLEVTPRITLSIAPAQVRNGQTITYTGRVRGGHIPRAGLPLDVEYRDGARWRIFDQTRARAKDGRFVYRYTFKRTTVAIVYTFRVAIPAGGANGYPYAPTASPGRSVRVNP